MCDDEECPDMVTNPLLMPALDFTAWLSGRGIDTVGIPPASPIKRASLLLELEGSGKISLIEIQQYLSEVGLMIPFREN
ncbi:MAG: hypothetical protein Q8P40_13140 [Nitrospirota bacterium]|nr:hypothetical protein [Nitrospirota bacterium]